MQPLVGAAHRIAQFVELPDCKPLGGEYLRALAALVDTDRARVLPQASLRHARRRQAEMGGHLRAVLERRPHQVLVAEPQYPPGLLDLLSGQEALAASDHLPPHPHSAHVGRRLQKLALFALRHPPRHIAIADPAPQLDLVGLEVGKLVVAQHTV